MSKVPLMPLSERPAMARKMIAVWRLHHLSSGEELSVTVWPGEWPDDQPHEVKGVRVEESDQIGGSGAMLVLGRVGEVWRGCYQLCSSLLADMAPVDLAICTAFMEVGADRDMKLWLHPSPETGDVPMWTVRKSGR